MPARTAASLLRTTYASDKESHELVANELVNHRIMTEKGLCRSDVEPVG